MGRFFIYCHYLKFAALLSVAFSMIKKGITSTAPQMLKIQSWLWPPRK